MRDRNGIQVRSYGASGPLVVLLHGGPAAPGYMATLARELAPSFRVLEPLQRGRGSEPLTVARHVADLDELVVSGCAAEPPALVGHSWGAMLALAYAAAHPGRVASLALIACGTFDLDARDRLNRTREGRMDDAFRRRLERLPDEIPDPDERLRRVGEMILPLYSHDLVANRLELEACDARAHRETWDDMLRLQDEGVYPAAFAAIEAPVLMLHGTEDPHPGPMIRESLLGALPRLEYRQWDRCGHYPWLERAVRDDFLAVLCEWLSRRRIPQDGGERGTR